MKLPLPFLNLPNFSLICASFGAQIEPMKIGMIEETKHKDIKMKHIIDFKNNDWGAVTVDWVVLTAAIVGIAMAVILLISGGIETASEGIDDDLRTAGTGWNFLNETSSSLDEYLAAYTDIRNDSGEFNDTTDSAAVSDALYANIAADSPADYSYDGFVAGDGVPIYSNPGVLDDVANDGSYTTNPTYSIGGQVVDQSVYDGIGGGVSVDQDVYLASL